MTRKQTVIVTGSSGLVGSRLVSFLSERGFHVRAFQRSQPIHPQQGIEYYPFVLEDVRDSGFEGADILVHCAYRPIVGARERASEKNTDIEAAKKIIALTRRYGIKVIFLSTTSAHPHSRSYYAQTKYVVEQMFDQERDLILKLGLVLGGEGGLFGKLSSNLRKSSLVPLIGAGTQQVQTVALEDVCRVIEAGIRNDIRGLYNIAHPAAVYMKDIYRGIAERLGLRPLFIPVPVGPAYYVFLILEKCGFRLPFTSQNIMGLNDLRVVDITPNISLFGVALQDCQTTLRRLHS